MLTGKKSCEATILKQYYTRIDIGQMRRESQFSNLNIFSNLEKY